MDMEKNRKNKRNINYSLNINEFVLNRKTKMEEISEKVVMRSMNDV